RLRSYWTKSDQLRTSSLSSFSSLWERSSTWAQSLLLLSRSSRSLQQRFLENTGGAGLGRSSPRRKVKLSRLEYRCCPGEHSPSLSPSAERSVGYLHRYSTLSLDF